MRYFVLSAGFVLVAAIILVVGLLLHSDRKALVRKYWLAWCASAVVVLSLTAVFDNVMIFSGLFTYSAEHRSGLQIGLAPLEDFTYPLAACLLLPGLWLAFSGHVHETQSPESERE